MSEFDLELVGVSYVRDSVAILDDISLKIPKGKATAVIGPSGSGKTSILKMAAGLIPPDRGDVFYQEHNLRGFSPRQEEAFRLQMGFAFQDAALWANKSIYENLYLPVKYHFPETPNKDLKQRAETLLRRLGYRDTLDLRPSQLSAGERKIVSFARSIVNDPTLLFLDNPLLSVDPHAADLITGHLTGLKTQGITLFLTSHDPKFLALFSDYIVVIDEGKIIDQGSIEDLKAKRSDRTGRSCTATSKSWEFTMRIF